MFHAQLLTIFPEFFDSPLACSIPQRAQQHGVCKITRINIRDFCRDKHRRVDDAPYGGGPGMVMKVQPVADAIRQARANHAQTHVIMLAPEGAPLSQGRLRELARRPGITLLCGRYEGIDARVEHYIDEKLSLGPFVLSGGEPAALAILDGIIRLLPGAFGNDASARQDSFAVRTCDDDPIFDWPHYTRPETYDSLSVPKVLRSGDHARIAAWRRQQALARNGGYPHCTNRKPLPEEE